MNMASYFYMFIGLNAHLLCVTGYKLEACDDFNPMCFKTNNNSLKCVNMFPEGIESEILNVEIGCFNNELNITKKTFSNESWRKIQTLRIYNDDHQRWVTLQNNCFVNLNSLKELKINIPLSVFDYGSLNGLDVVTLLDVSNCTRADPDIFLNILFNSSLLQLKSLALSSFGRDLGNKAFHLTDTFWQFVKDRSVSSLNLSYVMIIEINTRAFNENCDSLTDISLRGSYLFGFYRKRATSPKPCKSLRFLDISEIILPKHLQFMCQLTIPFENYSNMSIDIKQIIDLWDAETILLNQFCNGQSTLIFKNITKVHTKTDCDTKWNTLSLNGIGLKVLDIQTEGTICFLINLEVLSINDNRMEFINPTLMQSMRKLRTVDLSNNNLAFMKTYNATLFEKLFQSKTLKNINLSDNKITHLSHSMFLQCINLQTLNLSGNYLEDIDFHINQTRTLQILDMSYNHINGLSTETMQMLDSVQWLNKTKYGLDLSGNPLKCSLCSHLKYIQWLLSRTYVNVSDLHCTNDHGVLSVVNQQVSKQLENLCEQEARKKRVVLLSALLPTIIVVFIIVFIIGFVRYRRIRNSENNRVNVLRRLRAGDGDCEFAVFFAFSNKDDAFVSEHVVEPFRYHLKRAVKTDRNLLCVGDENFRFGRSIHDEAISCLRRSMLLVVLLLNDYLNSGYCKLEFDLALQLGKPVILMIKEQVNEELMSLSMSMLYRTNTRILWTRRGDNYVLKSTWDNVVKSILDTISNKEFVKRANYATF
ncbi:leucine-rich repeat-containing G-protein coupled receptor 4-like [Dreissena polymorpha]|uniref:leucine-rich repeat-containing G-protein coupled receptor 4-like n=1 Tax=Dreissena polymorpha TaxID=45954 RepID=UPI002263CD45|nr:leucine-rich repeat-containing G-protein coupled receptor 4-like [Dreissena polymorpha]